MVSGIGRIVARRHSHNTWGARIKIDNNPAAWQDITVGELPVGFWEDMKNVNS